MVVMLVFGVSPCWGGVVGYGEQHPGRQAGGQRHPDWPGGWQVVDGRHRYTASVLAGCSEILCTVVKEP